MATTFKQAQYTEYSDKYEESGQFSIVDAAAPKLRDGDVLVQVVCAATNPVDTVVKRGNLKGIWPGADKLPFTPGYDFAGRIQEVGKSVKGFKVGDQVCGVQWGNGSKGGRCHADDADDGPVGGSLAELMVVPASTLVSKPPKLGWKQAGAMPMVCMTAHQGLFYYNTVKSGDKVIIFGGSTAVGQIAVQLAKNVGANVFATCSTGKIDFVKGLGATPLDYTKLNWWEAETGFDAGFITIIGEKDGEHLKDAGVFKSGAICTSVRTGVGAEEEGTPKMVKFVFHQDANTLKGIVADVEARKVKIAINKVFDGLTAENVGAMFAEQAAAKSVGKNVMLCKAPKPLKKPTFGKIGKVRPEMKGLNFYVKCLKTAEAVEVGDIKESLCGDETGCVILSLRSDAHVALCKAGALLRVQNAHVRMVKGRIRLVVDKWSALKVAESVEFESVDEKTNVSETEYELK